MISYHYNGKIEKSKQDNDGYYNKKGGKIFYNINRQPLLEIPVVSTRHKDDHPASVSIRKMFEILGVGIYDNYPCITVKEKNNINVYRLPNIDYFMTWVIICINLAQSGNNIFPEFVEIGYISNEKRYYMDCAL